MIILSTTLYELILIYSIKKQRHGLAQFHSALVLSNLQKCIHGFNAGGGGGGATSICMHIAWVCAARETPIFSPEFLFRSIIIFTNFPQIRSGSSPFKKKIGGFCRFGDHHFFKSVPEHHHFTFFGGFCRSGDRHFPNAKRSAAPRVNNRPERQRQTHPGNSGE